MSSDKREKVTVGEFFSSIKWVVAVFWKINPRLTILSLITSSIIELINILNIFVFAKGIDILLSVQSKETDITWMYLVVGIFFGLSVLQNGLRRLSQYSDSMLRNLYRPAFQKMVYQKIGKVGIETLEDPKVNNMLERARQSEGRIEFLYSQVTRLVGFSTQFISSGIILFAFAPHFIPLFFLIMLPSVLVDRKFMIWIWRFDRELTEERRSAWESAYYLQNSKSLHELKITGGVIKLKKHFESFIDKWLTEIYKIRKRWAVSVFGFGIVRACAEAYADFYVFSKFLAGNITIGNLTFYIRQVSQFVNSISALANVTNSMYEASLTITEARDLFDLPELEDGNIELERWKVGPEIKIENLDFAYPNTKKQVLNNLNLDIKSGEKIAIVGHNGAGKTTLVKLLMRFYKPQAGSISINNINLAEIKIDDWYKNSSVLFQDYNSYNHLSVEDNIKIGKLSKKSEDSVIKAAKLAEVDSFVSDYKNKYKQILSEKYKGGIRPSTGQWQKIAIARFFYRNAPFIIFDEPTAAIDAVAESKIFNKIYKFFKKKTVIIISHRFSTVRNADRIIVFDKGKIVEEGSHAQLMKLDGVYANAFRLQAEGYK